MQYPKNLPLYWIGWHSQISPHFYSLYICFAGFAKYYCLIMGEKLNQFGALQGVTGF